MHGLDHQVHRNTFKGQQKNIRISKIVYGSDCNSLQVLRNLN